MWLQRLRSPWAPICMLATQERWRHNSIQGCWLRTRGTTGVAPSLTPKAWLGPRFLVQVLEPKGPRTRSFSVHGQEKVGAETELALICFSVLFRPAVNWVIPTPFGEGRSLYSVHWITCCFLRDTPGSHVVPAVWVPRSPVALPRKINPSRPQVVQTCVYGPMKL